MEGVRLDKWLHVARMFKTRTLATRACTLNRVKVNGQVAKPHRALAIGDTVELDKDGWGRVLVVAELAERPVAKADAAALYEDKSPPRPAPSTLERLLRRPPEQRDKGAGRPTKKDRRLIEKFRGDGAE